MNAKRPVGPQLMGNRVGMSSTFASALLRQLRRERDLVDRAIIALTELARTRQSRDRRPTRN